jgi:hypothetical protein
MVSDVRWLVCAGLVVTLVFTVGCTNSGDDGSNGGIGNTGAINKAVVCAPSGDDSTQNNDGSSSRAQSHSVGSPLYHSVTSRKNSLGQLVTLDYMVHQPMGTPKGIVLLIAGGALTGYIEGTEGNPATRSGGNFLVRSAHRFMQAGYRVITMDRPSDFANYGNIDSGSYLYDSYRTSIDHAIDITTIVNLENNDNLSVFIAGTSRGAISAVAQNMLATAIAISSPVTRSSAGGAPIGSPALPVGVVDVPVHVLYHQNDGCTGTSPTNSGTLINQLDNAGVDVTGNYLSGGFVDTVANNPCGAFGFHGFLGIENCAVNTTTMWMDDLLASVESQNPGNARPRALEQSARTLENQAIDINLSASDNDDTNLTYQLPYFRSSLGGSLSLNGNVVHYIPPAISTTTTDSFVFTVTDSKGSSSAAVVSANITRQGIFDHNLVTGQACVTCHDEISEIGKGSTHIISTDVCEACHSVNFWAPATVVDHNHVIGSCSNCHDGIIATGKTSTHIPTSDVCETCHLATGNTWLSVLTVDHDHVLGACSFCHQLPTSHIPVQQECNACHLTPPNSWLDMIIVR